jgi:SAM-dependent methyltransferase
MFEKLNNINEKPKPFEYYTASELWTNEHTSKKMLEFHLNDSIDLSSRNGDFIKRSVQWIIQHFNIDSQKSIADFGCGPGLYANKLAKTEAEITGIDFSKRSLDYATETAQEDNLKVDYVHTNYLEFETNKKFDLIIMIFCDFCALSPEQRRNLLVKFHSFLKPNGKLLMDVHSLNVFNRKQEYTGYEFNHLDHFWAEENYYCFINSYKYEREKVMLDKYTIVEKDRTREVYNWLQCFSKDSINTEFEENGFKIEAFYSDVAGTPFNQESDDIAVMASKK